MSSVRPLGVPKKAEFPWAPFRAVPALAAAYVGQYNILHHANKGQWLYPAACVLVALATVVASGYDKDPGDGLLGDLTTNNITWLMVILGLPIVAVVCGIIGGGALWIILGAIVLLVNAFGYFGFREPGWPGVVVLVCLVLLAVVG